MSPHFFKANDDEMSQKEVRERQGGKERGSGSGSRPPPKNRPPAFPPLQVYEFNVPTFGPGVVFDVDHKTRAEQFRFFADALKTARSDAYVPQFVAEARDTSPGGGSEGVVDLKDALAELTVMTAARHASG